MDKKRKKIERTSFLVKKRKKEKNFNEPSDHQPLTHLQAKPTRHKPRTTDH